MENQPVSVVYLKLWENMELKLFVHIFLAQHHSLSSNDMCGEKEIFSLTLIAASTCTGLTASVRTEKHAHSRSQSLSTNSGSTTWMSHCPAMHSYFELIILKMTKYFLKLSFYIA